MQIYNQKHNIHFQKNILVKNITTDGEIGHLAVNFAQKKGLYKGEAINTIGKQVGSNNFLIIDPKTSLGKIFIKISDFYNSFRFHKAGEDIKKLYDDTIDIIINDKKTITKEYSKK